MSTSLGQVARPLHGDAGACPRTAMVDWIENEGGRAYVQGPSSRADVHTVHPSQRAAYIKTEPNSTGAENLRTPDLLTA
ncbi:hypothetical protein R3Q15_23145 [Gordonia amicalis]|uniref:DUF3892 domain-containing protein n=1 Tax=Gordonia amicalis TaxID=89053 RepID=A0AAE4RAQ9_9ACTN|nr:hypothetical protein [Gordonia amicalis]MDV6314728.1 hypothetical protein [Gordonia amicalis]